MGTIGEFTLDVRLFLKAYRWRRIDPVPWTPLGRPLHQCRMALVSSAGFVLPGQTPFDSSIRGGDVSYREIAADAPAASLVDCHRSKAFDHTGMQADPNLGFPLDRARELADAGAIGSVNRRHISIMGSITAPGRLIQETLPQVAGLLRQDEVDIALLVPV